MFIVLYALWADAPSTARNPRGSTKTKFFFVLFLESFQKMAKYRDAFPSDPEIRKKIQFIFSLYEDHHSFGYKEVILSLNYFTQDRWLWVTWGLHKLAELVWLVSGAIQGFLDIGIG